jgi:hypothetical protein
MERLLSSGAGPIYGGLLPDVLADPFSLTGNGGTGFDRLAQGWRVSLQLNRLM